MRFEGWPRTYVKRPVLWIPIHAPHVKQQCLQSEDVFMKYVIVRSFERLSNAVGIYGKIPFSTVAFWFAIKRSNCKDSKHLGWIIFSKKQNLQSPLVLVKLLLCLRCLSIPLLHSFLKSGVLKPTYCFENPAEPHNNNYNQMYSKVFVMFYSL